VTADHPTRSPDSPDPTGTPDTCSHCGAPGFRVVSHRGDGSVRFVRSSDSVRTPDLDALRLIRELAVMKPEDEWSDKFYAALAALWRTVKGTDIPAMGEPPHVVMARLIEDVAWAALHPASPPQEGE
jgi:hypothetical protein